MAETTAQLETKTTTQAAPPVTEKSNVKPLIDALADKKKTHRERLSYVAGVAGKAFLVFAFTAELSQLGEQVVRGGQ